MRSVARCLLLSLLAAVAAVVGSGAIVSAGGWAVTTLDAVPAPVPGEPVAVGFTILQHGVTPVELTDVSIEVTGPDGASAVFPARLDGPAGHYVADVVFPAVGAYQWSVHPGWFETQSLGTVTVAAPAAHAAGSGGPPSWLAPALASLAVLLALAAVGDLWRTRRRRTDRALA